MAVATLTLPDLQRKPAYAGHAGGQAYAPRARSRHHDRLGGPCADGLVASGTVSFRPSRYDGGGMRYLRFTNWLTELDQLSGPIAAIWYEEVRRHVGTDAAHVYGGLMATLTAWAELRGVPYQGVPVGTVKRHATGKGNAGKEEMIAAARARGFRPSDDNEADALAILHWALETLGGVR